jgi:hypothetical protein
LYVEVWGLAYVDIIQGNNIVGSFYPPSTLTGGMAIGANNHIYIAAMDSSSVLINEYDENDTFVRQFRCPSLKNGQTQITIGPNGNIYGVENGLYYLNEIDLNGNLVRRVSTGSGSWPTGLAFGPDGYLYVGRDQYNDIAVYDPNTFALVKTITGVAHPSCVAFDPDNHHLFVVNWIGLPQITEYLYTGEFIKVFVSDGALSTPTMIVFEQTSANTTPTTTTISTTTTAPINDGLIAYYPFNGNANDESGTTNNGVEYGGIQYVSGKIDDAAKFDMSNYISVNDSSSLKLNTYTFAAWINADTITGAGSDGANRIFEKGAGTNYWLYIGNTLPATNAVATVGFNNGGYINISSNTLISANSWYHITGTYDGNFLKIYINGTLDNSLKISSAINKTNEPLIIGWRYNGTYGDHFSGLIDELRIYNRALSETEIQQLYENTMSTSTTTTVPATTTTTPYTPPDSRPYVTFIDENGCPIQYDQGGGFQFENINANTVPSKLFYKGIVHITPGYSYQGWTFTCYDLKIEPKYNTGTQDDTWFNNVTDGQVIYFAVDTTKIDKTAAERTNLVDVGVTFYECGEGHFAQPPQGLNLNQDSNGCPPVTVISLSSFTATPKNNAVTLEWSTESEIDNAGFNLYRSETENGNYIKINTSLIPSKGSSTQGASYEFIDSDVQNRKTYYYKLEDIDLNGKSTTHSPVSATPRLIYAIGK